MAAWEATVPFPAEDLGKCRGCGATIGWIQRVDEQTNTTKPHPVDPKGWHGQRCSHGAALSKKGYDRDGYEVSVCPFPEDTLFRDREADCFTSHFSTCPDAERFRQRKVAPRA